MAELKRVETGNAPAAIGPYSQAISVNGFVFTAGQIPLDPASGQLVEGDVSAQTKRVMQMPYFDLRPKLRDVRRN